MKFTEQQKLEIEKRIKELQLAKSLDDFIGRVVGQQGREETRA